MPAFDRKTALAAIVLLCIEPLLGCKKDGTDDESFELTDAGYRVRWMDEGTVSQKLHSKAVLFEDFDGAVDRAVDELGRKYGVSADQVRAVASATCFTLVDNRRFWIPELNTWASGCNNLEGGIRLVYWTTRTGPALPDLCCPWTAAHNPANDLWYWGVETRPFPALSHEVGHSIFGPTFEHPELGWRWP